MNRSQLIAYMDASGIPYTNVGGRLRAMDVSQLPGAYHSLFDERGFYMADEKVDKKAEEAALEAAVEKMKEIDAVAPMGETEKEMTTMALLNPEGNTVVPAHLESHEPKAKADEGDAEAADDEADDLEAHTVAELRDIAEDEEVDLTGLHLKADIIAAIEAKRKG